MTDNEETTGPKHPDIEVQLSGEDGNAFSIIARVRRALRDNGVSSDEVNAYVDEALRGSYEDLLVITMKWVTVL